MNWGQRKRSNTHGRDPRYNGTTWRRLRSTWLARHPLCVQCGDVAQMVDHVQPVRLNVGLDFYDVTNLASMCHRCHNAKRGRESHKAVTYTQVINGRNSDGDGVNKKDSRGRQHRR